MISLKGQWVCKGRSCSGIIDQAWVLKIDLNNHFVRDRPRLLEVAGTDEIRFGIVTWDSKTITLAPESLKGESMAEAEKIARQYQASIVAEQCPFYGRTEDHSLQPI